MNKSLPYYKIVSYYSLTLPHFKMDSHTHLAYEIMYVAKGQCQVEVESQIITLKEREFILIDTNVEHKLTIDSQFACTILNIEFEANKKAGLIVFDDVNSFLLGELKQEKKLICQDSIKVGHALQDLIAFLIEFSHNSTNTSLEQELLQLLFQRTLIELIIASKKQVISSYNFYVEKTLNYIHEHLNETIKISELVTLVGLNKSYLHKLFLDTTGTTIINYINQERIKQAEYLLINSNFTINEIAYQIGFNSRQRFGTVFQKTKQETPSSFRALNRSQKKTPKTNGWRYISDH